MTIRQLKGPVLDQDPPFRVRDTSEDPVGATFTSVDLNVVRAGFVPIRLIDGGSKAVPAFSNDAIIGSSLTLTGTLW